MKEMKRILSLVLVLVMLVGVLPATAFAAENTVLDAAIFCSDLHGSTSELTSVLGAIGTNIDASAIGFNGDTCLYEADLETLVQSNLSDASIDCVYSYASSHDGKDGGDIGTNWNYSGQAFANDHYIIYTIRETDMQNASDANTAAPAFTTWYNGLTDAQKALPIFILSHRPLHARRNDNAGAATWYEAISAAAKSSDIVFLWAHNHTGETSVDTNAYYVAKDGEETITVQGGSTVVPNFTYMNAGYMNANGQNPARKPVATTVQITADSLIFQDYTTSGEYTNSNYAHNVTVAREFAASEPEVEETTEPTTEPEETTEPTVTEQTFVSDDINAEVTATATGATLEYFYEGADADALLSFWYGYDISLEGQVEDTDVTIKFWLSYEDMSSENFAVYHLNEETGEYEEVTGYTVGSEDGVEYIVIENAKLGTYIYGTPNTDDAIPEGAVLESISIEEPAETTKYFDTDTQVITDENGDETVIAIDITGLTVKANYILDGETYSETIEWDQFGQIADGYALTHDPLIVDGQVSYGQKTVTLTYGEKTAQYNIWVCKENETVGDVSITFDSPSVVSVAVASEEVTETITTALAEKLKGTLVAYDITAQYANGDTALSGTASVTLPVPEGVENPAVYYVSDDGKTTEKKDLTAIDTEAGTVTFTTDHFSTYVVGESTEIEVPDPKEEEVDSSQPKTIYKLVSTPTAGNQYILVSSGSAGTAYALKENTTTGSSITINAASGDIDVPYIETTDETIMWNAASGMTFQSESGSYYLRYSDGLTFSTRNSTNWTVGTNSAYSYSSQRYRYLYNDDGNWTTSRSSSTSSNYNVYFYEKATVSESVKGTYSIAGEDLTKVVVQGTTADLTSTLTFTPTSGTATTKDVSSDATYAIVTADANGNVVNGDPNGIINSINGNTVTFTGEHGKALVQVTYTSTDPAYTVTNYITVTATAPVYDIEISQDGTTAANDTIAVRGVTSETELELSYILTYEDADGVQTLTPSSGITWYCYLDDGSDASSIASIDQTGKLTFTGAEGTIKVMVAYETSSGTTVNDIITINVRKSTAVTPSESTSDFPRWPNEGAVRFNKTATAIGNFSETGIAQVELSMAGIPVKTGGAVDVVIMLDMTGSMSDDAMAAAEESAIAFAEQIVKNDDGTYNDSRIAILAFNSGSSSPYTYWELGTVDSDTEWSSLCTAVRGANDDQVSGGTPYDEALEKCQEILAAAKTDGTGNDRQQFCVFVSDGGPTSYEYITNYDAVKAGTATAYTTSTASATGGSNQSDSNFATIATYTHEYYSTLMKDAGVTMYSVLTGLSADDYPNCTTILQNIASDSSKAYVVEDGEDTSAITNAFTAIADEINAAATNVNVEDVITDEYDLIFELPNSNIKGLPDGQEFYLEVVDYPLNETTHERTGESKILQRIYLETVDGKVTITKITYTDDSGNVVEQAITPVYTEKAKDTDKAYFDANGTYYPDGDGTHHMTSGAYVVLNDDGSLKSLHTVNFTYVVADQKLNWTVTSMSETSEVALRYFVYLKDSGGVDPDDQIDAGTYPTNKYASLTYTNHLGTECLQYFPKPQLTWNGAQVSYVFYLVNEDGVPVNRAGREVTFAEAVFVTDIYTHAIVWNDLEQAAGLEAKYLAENLIPDAYSLYDVNASYNIHVYEDEEGVNLNNHFVIAGTSGDTTTYVYNNKTDVTKYNEHGTYAASSTYLCKSYNVTATVENGVITAATYTAASGETQVLASAMESTTGATIINGYAYYIDENGDVYTIVQKTDATAVTGFDFANTTVAFAVVWEKKLVEDTVVVDFGLPVDIDVVSNDFVYNYIAGIGATDPNYGINIGYKTDTPALTAQNLTIDGHSVKVQDQNHIRFTPGSGTSMEFKEPVEFFYETTVEVYENSQVIPSYMYSKVTVIPATTVYYEDSFVDFAVYNKVDNAWTLNEDATWAVDGTTTSATQAQDRPGASQISADLDADNNYGYDAAYDNCSLYSLGSSRYVTANATTYGTATFTFYGTGFDVVSLTSNNTGTITVKIYKGDAASGTSIKNLAVDTYYGYTKDADGNWVVDTDADNALYQVPVISYEGLEYGQYTVVVKSAYNTALDHQGDGSYNFYLDAIRIYDPTGVVSGDSTNDTNGVVSGAYNADREAYPSYQELRANIIAASNVTVVKNTDGSLTATLTNGSDTIETLDGAVFIDGNSADTSISDYVSYGPNNELYLAQNQAIAFKVNLNSKNGYTIADVQLGMKSANGNSVTYTVNDDENTIATSTDMYYSIMDYAVAADGSAAVVTIKNTSDSVLSLTNIKVTYEPVAVATVSDEDAGISTASLLYTDEEVVTYSLMSLRAPAVEEEVPEETVPETTEPEETEPEETVPEETEPEETVPEETEPEETVPEETEPEVTVPDATEPEENTAGNIATTVKQVLNKIASALSNLFSRWFR